MLRRWILLWVLCKSIMGLAARGPKLPVQESRLHATAELEDGTLSLEDPASKWLGDRSWFGELPNASEIRLRHLLSHSAGLGDYPGRPGFLFSMVGRVDLQSLVVGIARLAMESDR